jgi:lysophospholipase
MGIPLRGELTLPSGSAPGQPTIEQNLESIQGILSQFVRLSSSASRTPKIVVSVDSMDEATQAAAKPWSWTAAEAASTESALVPFLIHLAAARDDAESLKFCLSPATDSDQHTYDDGQRYGAVPGGVVNCLDPASGRSPLHVAALNGSTHCAGILLKSGALVHLRDALGHTSLYYASKSTPRLSTITYRSFLSQAARQGHELVVDNLVKVGANLGGSDLDGGFAMLAVQNALRARDQNAIRIWAKAGMKMPTEHDM